MTAQPATTCTRQVWPRHGVDTMHLAARVGVPDRVVRRRAVQRDLMDRRPGRHRGADVQGARQAGGDGGRVRAAVVRGGHVDGAGADPDVGPAHRRLAGRHVRQHLEQAVAELRIHPELLVHHRPEHAVGAPGLVQRGPLVERLADVGGEVGRRADLRHRAGLLGHATELQRGEVVGVPLLLARAEQAVVAQADRHHAGVEGVGLLGVPGVGARVAAGAALDVQAVGARVAGRLAQLERGQRLGRRDQARLGYPVGV